MIILLTLLSLAGPTLADADAAFQAKDWAAAAKAYAKVTKKEAADDAGAWFRLGYARHLSGDHGAAIAAYQRAIDLGFYKTVANYNLACVQALTGDVDGAFASLDRSIAAGLGDVDNLRVDPDLASLRDDPRYAPMLERADANARPCEHDDRYRAFDFWVGSWVVYDPQGVPVGKNEIAVVERGCVLTETWTSGSGRSGRSLNFFDPVAEHWVQVWVDDSGTATRFEGNPTESGMVLVGVRHPRVGDVAQVRGTWTRNDDGSVLQVFERSADGQTWTPAFSGRYVKAPAR